MEYYQVNSTKSFYIRGNDLHYMIKVDLLTYAGCETVTDVEIEISQDGYTPWSRVGSLEIEGDVFKKITQFIQSNKKDINRIRQYIKNDEYA